MSIEQENYYGTFHDAITGETVVRQLTEQEIISLPNLEEIIEQQNIKQQTKQSAINKLLSLGLTQEEVDAILGFK